MHAVAQIDPIPASIHSPLELVRFLHEGLPSEDQKN